LFGVDLGVCPFEISWTEDAGRPMPRTRHKNHVQVKLLNEPIQVEVRKSEAGTRAPVPKQAVLYVLRLQGLLQERIGLQINHAERQVVARSPVGMGLS